MGQSPTGEDAADSVIRAVKRRAHHVLEDLRNRPNTLADVTAWTTAYRLNSPFIVARAEEIRRVLVRVPRG